MTDDSPLASAEWLALVAAMRFAPDDDTPRLVGADWLQETGRPELSAWGEFIRYQCEAATFRNVIAGVGASHPPNNWCDCGSCRPERRATAIADRWAHEWRWHTWDVAPVDAPTKMWWRGFVTVGVFPIEGPNLKRIVKCVPPMFERQPVRGMTALMRHTLPTHHMAISLVCGIETRLADLSKELIITARLTRKDRAEVAVTGVRWARKPNQFGPAVSAAVGEAIKRRTQLVEWLK